MRLFHFPRASKSFQCLYHCIRIIVTILQLWTCMTHYSHHYPKCPMPMKHSSAHLTFYHPPWLEKKKKRWFPVLQDLAKHFLFEWLLWYSSSCFLEVFAIEENNFLCYFVQENTIWILCYCRCCKNQLSATWLKERIGWAEVWKIN